MRSQAPDRPDFRHRDVYLSAKLRQLTEGSRDVALPTCLAARWIVGSSENFHVHHHHKGGYLDSHLSGLGANFHSLLPDGPRLPRLRERI